MTGGRINVYSALAFAAIFALLSYALEFGPILSIASGLIGAASGSFFIDRSQRYLDPHSREIVERIRRGEVAADVMQAKTLLQDRKGLSKLLLTISIILGYQSPLQRVASYTFLIQLVISIASIFLFVLIEGAGVQVNLMDNPSLARLFAGAFPMDTASAAARVRFDHLFVPLASLYAISVAMFCVAFLASIPSGLNDPKRHVPALFLSLVMLFGLWSFFFVASSYPAAPQRFIVRGDLWGYIVVFVLVPMFCLILTAALPNSNSRRSSTLGTSDGNS